MITLDLNIIVPATEDARARGCICPEPGAPVRSHSAALFVCGEHVFDPACPIHRHAVMAEVQRQFGRPQ
ncbi:hypothetical protein [Paracoccus denitrificans]|uniref:hypothetical protein n=1 Tax=Paracoccus denitrificans TaxID=266 RepID=UPI0033650AD4